MTMIATMRRAAILGGVALAAIGLSSAAFAQKTKLTVYTAIENEQLEPFKKAFEADNPTIEIAWVRDSTGVMTAKLIAEKDNPRADVISGSLKPQSMVQGIAPEFGVALFIGYHAGARSRAGILDHT